MLRTNNRSVKSIKVTFRDLLKKMEDVFSSNYDYVRLNKNVSPIKKKKEKLRIIKFQNIEGKLYVYSTSLRTSYFRCKHRS